MELLAPAGNIHSLHAAISAGADAVYLGLDAFNARRNADNFTRDTLKAACDYAHLRQAKIYVTMNTVILQTEMDDAMGACRDAYLAGADAVIVQDIGLASLLRQQIPELPLHVSTQMNIHNVWGLEACAELGAKRVTLARELSLEEIAIIGARAKQLSIEIETFAHGAICICYSGQCFMSSMIGGRSANRGLCAQACRLPYELHRVDDNGNKPLKAPGEFLLSPKDLCAADDLQSLAAANVSSIKIEGRMKSPEYVASVVGVYRALLDRVEERGAARGTACAASRADGVGEADAAGAVNEASGATDGAPVKLTEQERTRLGSVFSRGFSPAYLEGIRDNSMMAYQRPNNRGQFIGRVKSIDDGIAHIGTDIPLVEGDLLEFWTRKGNVTYAVTSKFEQGRKTAYLPFGDKERSVRVGDRAFRVRSAEAAFKDDEMQPRIPLVGIVQLKLGEPLSMTFSLADPSDVQDDPSYDAAQIASLRRLVKAHPSLSVAGEGSVIEAARSRAITEDDVKEHIARTGSTPFTFKQIDVELDAGVGIGFSALHHLRADLLDQLQDQILKPYTSRKLKKLQKLSFEVRKVKRKEPRIAVLVTNPDCARKALKAGAHEIYVPAVNYKIGQSETAGALDRDQRQAGFPKHCILAMPVADHEIDSAFDVWEYAQPDKLILTDSLGSLYRASSIGAHPIVGAHLPMLNPASLYAASAFGAERAWLSPELNLAQIKDLAKASPIPLGVKVFGAQELMVTKHCALMSQGDCTQDCETCPRRSKKHVLHDRKGYDFPVVTDAFGRSHIYNSVTLDMVPSLPDLIDAGISDLMIDSTLMTPEQTAQATGRLVHAIEIALAEGSPEPKISNTTSGHLHRGIS